jgi:hypothetical protein
LLLDKLRILLASILETDKADNTLLLCLKTIAGDILEIDEIIYGRINI